MSAKEDWKPVKKEDFADDDTSGYTSVFDGAPQSQKLDTFHNTNSESDVPDLASTTLILQPDSSPISTDQLAAEVKAIYAGLIIVEAKCINVDAAQAASPTRKLEPEQWKAITTLHRQLLYEHYDFLMATQHTSATSALRSLAEKYRMPARMWRHGIHPFLELLRSRRPESLDYMLAFIYMAYQMMALLFEVCPAFTDTWIECLGDLARYRMVIEDEQVSRAIWAGVAKEWYTMTSDKHPTNGRLYHHIGVTCPAGIEKFLFYAKAMDCVIPFPNAYDSLATMCGLIVQEVRTPSGIRRSGSAEAMLVAFHALAFSAPEDNGLKTEGSRALSLLGLQLPRLSRKLVTQVILTNISAMLEYGSSDNLLRQLFEKTNFNTVTPLQPSHFKVEGTHPSDTVVAFNDECFAMLVQRLHSTCHKLLHNILPAVHVSLVWMHGLGSLLLHTEDSALSGKVRDHMLRFPWSGLCKYLNSLSPHVHALGCSRPGDRLGSENSDCSTVLTEDFAMRGLIWTQSYFTSGRFDTQGLERDEQEPPSMHGTRIVRLQRIAWELTLHTGTEYIKYDDRSKSFWSPLSLTTPDPQPRSSSPPTLAPFPPSSRDTSRTSSMKPGYAGAVEYRSRPRAAATTTAGRVSQQSIPRGHGEETLNIRVSKRDGDACDGEFEASDGWEII